MRTLQTRCLRAASESATQTGAEVVAQQIPAQVASEVVAQAPEALTQVVPVPACVEAPIEPVAVSAAKRARQFDLPSQQAWQPLPDLQPVVQASFAACIVQFTCGITTSRFNST